MYHSYAYLIDCAFMQSKNSDEFLARSNGVLDAAKKELCELDFMVLYGHQEHYLRVFAVGERMWSGE